MRRKQFFLREGFVTEGASSNVFAVVDGVVRTPQLSPRILAGVTRNLLAKILPHHDVPFSEAPISAQALASAQEIWITSSSRELVAVIELDGQPVADGQVGPVFRRAKRAFDEYKAQAQ